MFQLEMPGRKRKCLHSSSPVTDAHSHSASCTGAQQISTLLSGETNADRSSIAARGCTINTTGLTDGDPRYRECQGVPLIGDSRLNSGFRPQTIGKAREFSAALLARMLSKLATPPQSHMSPI
jgi:hypothetical protein